MNKENNKKLKKYKGKSTTKGRVSYAKGGTEGDDLGDGGRPRREDGYRFKLPPTKDNLNILDGKGGGGGGASGGTSTTTVSTANQGATDPNRTDRTLRTGQNAEVLASGTMSPNIPTIPEPREISDTGTKLEMDSSKEMQDTGGATAGTVATRTENVTTGTAQTGTAERVGVKTAGTTQVMGRGPTVTAQTTESKGIDQVTPATLGERTTAAEVVVDRTKTDAKNIDAFLSSNAFAPEVNLDTVESLAPTADAEEKERTAITGSPAPKGTASTILKIAGYEAHKQRVVTGKEAIGSAANMLVEVGTIPQDIAAAIVEDPASVEAQIDSNPVEVNAAIAALPTEALVSSQMESLIGGMEDGKIPMWAKPAVDALNQNMAARGMSISTVGRDSLFNSIIQSALPLAQGNAQALQSRAAQNLSNEQQANLQQATQEQQLRLQNLANRQDSTNQTAQMSQQMKTMQSQFTQQAVMSSAEQTQQTRTQNLQNAQQRAVIKSQNDQQAAMQNLGNEQQINMAELQIEANIQGADQNALNQEEMARLQISADFLSKNAGFKQQMDIANMSNDQQMRLANLSAMNQADSESLSNAQQTELANLNKNLQSNLLQANIAKDLGLAQLNVDQQTAIQNASTQANMDMTKFNADQQVELANSKFMQTVSITDMNAKQQAIMQDATALASMDIANLNTRERLTVESAKNFLSYDMANLNNEQQSEMMRVQQQQQLLLSDQSALNASAQFNAQSENQTNQFMASMASQMEQFNVTQLNGMEQFNVSNKNSAEARRSSNELQASSLDAQLKSDVSKFNSQQDAAREQFNTQQATVIDQSNVEWRRKSNTADTAAFNAVNQQNAQNAFGLSASANNFLWQELRDEADQDFKRWDNDQQRKASLLIAALGNEQGVNKKDSWNDNMNGLANLLNGWLED